MSDKQGVTYKLTLRNGGERYEMVYRQCELTALMRAYNAIKAEQVDHLQGEEGEGSSAIRSSQ